MCPKRTLTLILLLASVATKAQRERVHLDVSRYSAHTGDTLFFKGAVFKGRYPSRTSTNLYVQLLSENGAILSKQVFPVLQGLSKGQVIIPDSLPSANYYLVALTRQQLNYDDTSSFFSVPILVYNKVAPANVRHQRQAKPDRHWTSGNIKGIFWMSQLKDPAHLWVLLRIDSPCISRQLKIEHVLDSSSSMWYDITLNQKTSEQQFLIPIDTAAGHAELMLQEDGQLLGRQWITLGHNNDNLVLDPEIINTTPYGYNSWDIDVPEQGTWFTSISVTDADLSIPDPRPIGDLNASFTEDYTVQDKVADTAFISLPGMAVTRSGKSIRDEYQEVLVMGAKDSAYLFTKMFPLDAQGRFCMDSLFFFGKIDLQFQMNKGAYADPKNVRLNFNDAPIPTVNVAAIRSAWEDDNTPHPMTDTLYTPVQLKRFDLSKMKTLKEAIVRGRKDLRKELDNIYASGAFSEPTAYSYDLRTDSSNYNRDILNYINSLNIRVYYDIIKDSLLDRMNHPVHLFVDEQEYNIGDLSMVRTLDFDLVAYIKVLESDFLSTSRLAVTKIACSKPSMMMPKNVTPLSGLQAPTPINICIYTRKGKDFRTMRGGMNTVSIKGYDPILPFNSDEAALLWDPTQSGHHFTVKFNNSASAKRFRLRLEGVNYAGKVIHYETTVDENTPTRYKDVVVKKGGE